MKYLLISVMLVSINCIGQDFQCGDLLLDSRDNEEYKTVLIGEQCWMAENLNFGNQIDSTNYQSNNGIHEKFCYSDSLINCDLSGGLYQWSEMMDYKTEESTTGICPYGWHIPSDLEWKKLELHLGMDSSEINLNNVFRGENEALLLLNNGNSNFDALYSGVFNGSYDNYGGKNSYTLFWTSTSNIENNYPYRRGVYDYETRIFRGTGNTDDSSDYGYSVRCIQVPSIINSTIDSQFEKEIGISIYPNPVRVNLTIELSSTFSNSTSLEILNSVGFSINKIALKKSLNTVDVSSLVHGVYFLRIMDDRKIKVLKFIKQ